MAQPRRFQVILIRCTSYSWASRYGLGCIDPHNTTVSVCSFFCSLYWGLRSPTTASILSVSARSITPPLGVSNECKTRICIMPTIFEMGTNHYFVFPMLHRGLRSPTTTSILFVSAQSITLPLGISNECNAIICVMSTTFTMRAIVLSFSSTLPRTTKVITFPLSSFSRAMVCTHSSWIRIE